MVKNLYLRYKVVYLANIGFRQILLLPARRLLHVHIQLFDRSRKSQ